jgi:hypothetical protein
MVLTLTPAGLSDAGRALTELSTRQSLGGLASMVLPAVSLGLVCARAAMHARSARRAVLGCLGAGVVFAFSTFSGGMLMLLSRTPQHHGGDAFIDMAAAHLLPGQTLAFALSLLGLALPVSRAHRTPSCDAVHEALVVTGAWLLTAGTLVRWNGLGLTIAAHVPLVPGNWSLPSVVVGLTLLVAGVVADCRLLVWIDAVRRGDDPGWRIEPLADREIDVSLFACGSYDLDGLLIVERDGGPLPVARVFLEGSDRRRLLRARAGAATAAVVLLLAVVPTVLALVWPQRW